MAKKEDLERIVDASPAVLYRCEWRGEDDDLVTTYVSASVTDMFGYERRACLESGWWLSHIHPDDLRAVVNHVQNFRQSGELEHVYRFATESGEYRWVRDHACLNKGVNGKPDECIGSWLDITESRQRDQQVYENEELYRSLVEQAFDGIVIIGADGRLVFANQTCAVAWGGKLEGMIGKRSLDAVHPDEKKTILLHFKQCMDGNGSQKPYETRLIRKNGETAWVEISDRLITWHGQPADLITLHDITERKLSHARAIEFNRIIEESLNEIYIFDAETLNFIQVNRGARLNLGYTLTDFKKMTPLDLKPAFTKQMFLELIEPLRHGSVEKISFNSAHKRKDGSLYPVDINIQLSTFQARPVYIAMIQDITERQEREQEMLRMQAIIDQADDCIYATDLDGRYILLNQASERLLKQSREQLLGKSFAPFLASEHLEMARSMTQQKLNGQVEHSSYELDIIDAEGGRHPMENNSSLVKDCDGNPIAIQGVLRDISGRKEAEAQLRLLENAVGSVNESIIITDAEGSIVYVNPSFTRNTGFTRDDAIGNTPAILNSKQQSKGFYEQFWYTISHGKPWSGRILDRRKDGTIFPVYLSVAPIINDKGAITHYVAVHEDLSRAESLQKKMMQAQKMEAVGTMVGGVAHDFNNMLASIVGNFYLIRMQHPDDEKLQQRIRSMEDATRHGANLIRQMLTFARRDHPEMHTMQLSSFIKEAHKLASATMPENIDLELHILDADYVCVKADATQLQQVLLNLVTNARHAVQDVIRDVGQGCIIIEVDCRQPPSQLLRDNPEMMTESDWCCIRCIDNGSGIKAEDLEHVFEPFFTTKEVGKGTGLGMAMVYGAVQNHRGLIDIDSAPGEGSTISIWLPQHRAAVARVMGEDEISFDGGDRMILLVDDEDGLRKVLAEVLEHNGFCVLQASDGEQAVTLFRANREQVALVLMDVVMPNMGGVMAAQEIRRIDAHVPIIFQTGYGEQTQLDAASSIPASAALQKPVLIPEMLRTIMAHIQR